MSGDEDVGDIELPHESVDLVIMNPPFTRPTNHETATVPVPSFAGFQTTDDEQRAMSDRLADMRRGLERPAGHGNAGLASNFIDLAHVKAKPGGVVAFVLPIAAIQGESWSAARALLARHYEDVAVVAIAAPGGFRPRLFGRHRHGGSAHRRDEATRRKRRARSGAVREPPPPPGLPARSRGDRPARGAIAEGARDRPHRRRGPAASEPTSARRWPRADARRSASPGSPTP